MSTESSAQSKLDHSSLIDFSAPLDAFIEDYPASDPPLPVTRANFTSFLIQTFALSHGIPELHLLVFDWFAARTGQDIIGIVSLFFDEIGFRGANINNVLADRERTAILAALRQVKNVDVHDRVSEANLGRALDEQLYFPLKKTANLRESLARELGKRRSLELSLYGSSSLIAPADLGQSLVFMPRSTLVNHIQLLKPKKSNPAQHY